MTEQKQKVNNLGLLEVTLGIAPKSF